MKRSNDHEQFMRWQYLSSKKGKEELSSAERKQEFQAFMKLFESMKNECYQQQDSNSSDSPNPSNDLSTIIISV